MDIKPIRESAKIYSFPVKRRDASANNNGAAVVMPLASARYAKVAVGGAWYHDEAIEEADPTRKH